MIEKYNNLIYDVGMHRGEDTDFYLKKGFNVIAFEANPDLVKHCKERFSKEIQIGQLIIVEGAIVDFNTKQNEIKKTVKFFKNNKVSVWGTVVEDWASRNEHLGTSNEVIEVSAINFSEYLQKYGIPYYLKIDIEGMDMVCLKSLLNYEEKPDYISIESDKLSFKALKEEFKVFNQLGYNRFKAVNQANISKQKEPKKSTQKKYLGYSFLRGATGLFGTDLPGNWKNEKQILNQYKKIFLWYKLLGDYGILKKNLIGKIILRCLRKCYPSILKTIWYDTHAKHNSVK